MSINIEIIVEVATTEDKIDVLNKLFRKELGFRGEVVEMTTFTDYLLLEDNEVAYCLPEQLSILQDPEQALKDLQKEIITICGKECKIHMHVRWIEDVPVEDITYNTQYDYDDDEEIE
jgi:hypothetical protein